MNLPFVSRHLRRFGVCLLCDIAPAGILGPVDTVHIADYPRIDIGTIRPRAIDYNAVVAPTCRRARIGRDFVRKASRALALAWPHLYALPAVFSHTWRLSSASMPS